MTEREERFVPIKNFPEGLGKRPRDKSKSVTGVVDRGGPVSRRNRLPVLKVEEKKQELPWTGY